MEPKISCRHVWKIFGPNPEKFFRAHGGDPTSEAFAGSGYIPAVRDATLDVFPGEILVIMGLSGSGKSTLVRCLSRLIEPTGGEILFDGRDLLKATPKEMIELRRHKMGMVFQHFALLPHRTVLHNVAFPLEVQGAADLIAHPANDYVAEFTREVPRDRLLTVEDVMASDIDPGAGAAPVQASAPIHAAARRILQSDTPLRVVDENDATRGSISRADVIDALFEDRSVRS